MPGAIESRLSVNDGTELFVRDWMLRDTPEQDHGDNDPQPCIVIMHGLGEHCGRYRHVAAFLHACGFAVRSYDHRGHGQSGGARADVPGTQAMVHDAEVVIQDFADRCHTVPILLGHSMGGLFAAHLATAGQVPLRGLILSSPALALRMTGVERALLKVMTLVAPHLAVSNGVDPAQLSHDPAVGAAYDSDPLVHKKITAQLLNDMLASIAYAQSRAPLLAVPTLMLVAGNDNLIDPQGSRDFYSSLPTNLATLHWYDDLYHEIFNEVKSDQVFDALKTWLAARQFVT